LQLYRRITKTFSDVGTLVPAEDSIYRHVKDKTVPHFSSIYLYNQEQYDRSEEIITVKDKDGNDYERKRGIAGITDVVTNKIVFDLDCVTDIENARKDTIEVCNRLAEIGIPEESLQISFSGKKGFAVEVEFETHMTPPEMKNVVTEIAGDLKTFDSVVVNASRVFRIPLTKHADTGLYKTPISIEELKHSSLEEIQEIAKETYPSLPEEWKPTKMPEKIAALKKKAPEPPKPVAVVAGEEHDLDFSKMPKGFSKWKYALLNGYFPEGCRSNALMILVATFRHLGYPKNVAYYMAKSAAEAQATMFGNDKFHKDDLWNTVVKQVYGPTWKGACYSEENFPLELQEYLLVRGVPRTNKKKDGLQGIDEIFGTFKNFAENIEKNTIKTGIPTVDKKVRLTTGMLVGLLGGCGSGKTSISLEILNQVSLNGEDAIFFSMDMGDYLVYQKLCQTGSRELQERQLHVQDCCKC
jgi:hypothetical protein